ncbi:hypothetical protein GCM10019059_10150 [Camelimonas fluminis]|nr:hypothetical protein GCM10019059_10150 [Camelimonas fluminis]
MIVERSHALFVARLHHHAPAPFQAAQKQRRQHRLNWLSLQMVEQDFRHPWSDPFETPLRQTPGVKTSLRTFAPAQRRPAHAAAQMAMTGPALQAAPAP